MAKTVKIALGVPSYKGPDKHVFSVQWEFLHYLGRLQERSFWLNHAQDAESVLAALPPLDRFMGDPGAELHVGDPVFEFCMADLVGFSLIGLARDQIVKRALENECDYVFFFDDDMAFPRSTFLKLYRHQVEFIAALAFTSREPIAPVLYRFRSKWNVQKRCEELWSEPIFDYPQNELFRVDGTGTGVVLISTECFRKIKSPWFYGSMPTVGEDVYFSLRCREAGIPIFCDTSVKTIHVPNEPTHFMDESRYQERKEATMAWWRRDHAPLFEEIPVP